MTSIHTLEDAAAQARWQALWEGSPQRSSFSSLSYARAVARAAGLQCEMHLAAHEGRDEAGVLVFWRKRGPFRVVVVPPFTQYTPFVLRAPTREADVHGRRSALDALLAGLEARFHRLCFFCFAITDIRPALWRTWRATPFYTYRLALDDDGRDRWSESTRRTFRNQAAAYRVEEHTDAGPDIVELAAASYRRHERPFPAPPRILLPLIHTLSAEGHLRLFTATPHDGNRPEGGLAVLHDGRTAHYWMAGSQPGPAMTILLGTVLPLLREDGICTFDFVGANTPWIAEFKRRFGPELTPYFYLEHITHPVLRLLARLRGS